MISERAIRRVTDRFRLANSTEPALLDRAGIQIILDGSASMASGDGSKEQRARELVIVLLRLAVQAGEPGTLWGVRGADRNRAIEAAESERVAHMPLDGASSLMQSWPADLPANSRLRIVVSDFLTPDEPRDLVRRANDGAAKLCLLQLLDPQEIEPLRGDRVALTDIESDEVIELVLDSQVIAEYRRRLTELQAEYSRVCDAVGAAWLPLSSATELDRICGDQLVSVGMLCEAVVTH
jgi:hypothetical protein